MATASTIADRIVRNSNDGSGNAKPFSTKVSQLRVREALTQAEFATKYKIPQRTLQNWEQGHVKDPGAAARLLVALIEASPEETASLIKKAKLDTGLELVSVD